MKYGLPMVIVGILILFTSIFVTGWMYYDATDFLIHSAPHLLGLEPGATIELVPENNLLFSIARYGSWALPLLGSAIIILGMMRLNPVTGGNLPMSSFLLAAGLLVTALGFFITLWGFPTSFQLAQAVPGENGDLLMRVHSNPGMSLNLGPRTAALSLIPFGLLAAGYGIVQFFKLRHQPDTILRNGELPA